MNRFRDFIQEASQASMGTVDEYLSGTENVSWDRRSTKGSNLVGHAYVTIDGKQKKVHAYRIDHGQYIAVINLTGKPQQESGKTAKAAFLKLLKGMKNV